MASPIRKLISALRLKGDVRDELFDGLLLPEWQEASEVHWTPAKVCIRAAQLLDPRPRERVLDIGSGIGKFCLLGSLATLGVFEGVEQRARLVREAQRVARALGAWRARFVLGDAFDLDWTRYRCLYLYNPFAELRFEPERCIDGSLPSEPDLYQQRIVETAARLKAMPVGTRVVTFHGYGGLFSHGYVRRWKRWVASGDLELWVKQAADGAEHPARPLN